ncbi:PH domain-containing protein [Gephyromycinifex aptenodytis]|uniref:PH domain-containing protein n=1 Tax=Gephyromycinifex aptenodytis TaxID=2716227 RepID=UPI0014459409|nr:PH domain-containing protein [Gephyromycinifex aptenodytis]
MKPEQHPDAERLRKYLLRDERIIVATHRHWVSVIEPFLTATIALIAIAAIFFGTGAGGGLIELLLIAWLILFGRAGARLWEWNLEWFVATDSRILLIYGFIIRKVDMLPMSKVTDMTFHRSILGRLCGYGTFILESAGQDQALSDLHFIPDPNETYLQIVGTIFHSNDDKADAEQESPEAEEPPAEQPTGRRLYGSKDANDPWEEDWQESWDDPTSRPSLRGEVARLDGAERGHGRRKNARKASGPVLDRQAGHPDLAETLYSSRESAQADPYTTSSPHENHRRRWWQR